MSVGETTGTTSNLFPSMPCQITSVTPAGKATDGKTGGRVRSDFQGSSGINEKCPENESRPVF